MKIAIFSTLTVLVALAFSSSTQAQVGGRAGFKIQNVQASLQTTPKYQTDYKKRFKTKKWLELEVEFEAKPDFTEELTIKYYVFINKKLLVGEVTHTSVAKGRGLYSVMYISPQSLDFILEGKTPGANDAEHVGVQILVNGQLVAEASTSGAPRGQWWQTVQNTSGYLLNKNQTPFGPLAYDRYEAIKATTR